MATCDRAPHRLTGTFLFLEAAVPPVSVPDLMAWLFLA
jgi:hypothetical protein